MLCRVTFLVAVALVGPVLSDQSQEMYKKDDTTFTRGSAPKFRDPSDFTTPSSEAVYVTIDGLPSNQHGFKLVNPQYQAQQSSKKMKVSEKEEIRKQEEFVRSILEANKAAIDPQKSTSNIFRPSQPLSPTLFENGAFKSESLDDSVFGRIDLFGTGVPQDTTADAHETTTHSVFSFHFPQENKETSSLEDFPHSGKDFIGGRPKPHQRFNVAPASISGKKQSFGFGERGAFQQDAGPAEQDFGSFEQSGVTSVRPAFTRVNTNLNRKHSGVAKPEKNAPSLESGFPFTSEGKFGSRLSPGLMDFHSSVVPEQGRFGLRGQGEGDDEESKFISQVNQNTASFVSKNAQVEGFHGSVPMSFETIQGARDKPRMRIFAEDFPVVTQPAENKRRKESGQRSRRPFQNSGFREEETLPLPPITGNRFSESSKFRNSNVGEFEKEVVDRELEARKQAEGAKYSFASAITDTINDKSQSRQEVRDGLKLKGMYSYSDGYFKRTVYYEADEGGFRVVKEENEPIGNGPQFNPNGEVHVDFEQAGSNLHYSTKGDQVRKASNRVRRPHDSQRFDNYDDQLELPN